MGTVVVAQEQEGEQGRRRVLLESTTVRATRMARAENGAPKAGAMMCCPLNMCLAPLWLYSMSKYRHKRTHTFKKTVGAFARRERTVVEMHSDNIPGRMQDFVNHMTGGLTGHFQAGGRW